MAARIRRSIRWLTGNPRGGLAVCSASCAMVAVTGTRALLMALSKFGTFSNLMGRLHQPG
jgi:hypothetical protein